MKGILEIPEMEITFELDDMSYNQFRRVGTRPIHGDGGMVEKYPIGEPIILITSNMPDDLKNEIKGIISKYCDN